MVNRLFVLSVVIVLFSSAARAEVCIDCHKKTNSAIVSDWQLSKHSKKKIGCAVCHGSLHKSAADAAQARFPTPDTCAKCHAERVAQFKKGKHALGWAAMNALPIAHMTPAELAGGNKGCGGCHKIGLKSEKEIAELRKKGSMSGVASCDACHTRHTFSVAEARQPQACRTCHEGLDYAQWETYSNSKHGVRALLKQVSAIPAKSAAPTCQNCHMQHGDHEVRNAWGCLFLRMPMPEDKEWAGDRATIFQALGALDPDFKPTPMLEGAKALDMLRMTQESWRKERDKMVKTCVQCHSEAFAKRELAKGDRIVWETDLLMAEGIRTVATLYKDGILQKTNGYAYPFPNIVTFNYAPTPIEMKLSAMFFDHRMHAIMGAFHSSPINAYTHGWSEMRGDLTEINAMAADLRRNSSKEK
jgi:hydroxylamine dehydrogenase